MAGALHQRMQNSIMKKSPYKPHKHSPSFCSSALCCPQPSPFRLHYQTTAIIKLQNRLHVSPVSFTCTLWEPVTWCKWAFQGNSKVTLIRMKDLEVFPLGLDDVLKVIAKYRELGELVSVYTGSIFIHCFYGHKEGWVKIYYNQFILPITKYQYLDFCV